jgi:hypothetical protein
MRMQARYLFAMDLGNPDLYVTLFTEGNPAW